jgi:hypothetical protein
MTYLACVVLAFSAIAADAASAKPRTVKSELSRLAASGRITATERTDRLADFNATKRAAKRLPRGTTRRRELDGVVGIVEGIAARRKLNGPRLVPLWLMLDTNRGYWTTHLTGPSTRRISFSGSQLVWQYFPGQGLQFHPLANFAKLNALWSSKSNTAAGQLLDELLPLRVPRAGGVAWEYDFSFGGGRPPWVSGMAQGTGVEAMSRVAKRLGRQDEVLPILKQALGIFRTNTPEGVRVPTSDGPEYALYSFAPNLHVINGFLQALIGLYDLAKYGEDPDARALYEEGEAVARREVPNYDTGAWSLYSRGTSSHESDLNYHVLLRDFLAQLCARTAAVEYCGAAQHFTAYLAIPPAIQVLPRTLRPSRVGKLRFTLSKISRVTVTVSGRTVFSGTLAHGTKSLRWRAPKRTGDYAVTVSATDLAGNTGSASGTVTVAKG